MRKIKSNFFISLDGVVESPNEWHFPYFDDEIGAAVGAGFATADALLMGRVLYDEWAAYWPEHADEPFGDVMNSIKSTSSPTASMTRSGITRRSSALEGELTFQVGDELKTVRAGDSLLASRGTPHTFANHSGQSARALIAVTPAGFERYFRLVHAELTGTVAPPEALGPRPATELVGPPIARNPG